MRLLFLLIISTSLTTIGQPLLVNIGTTGNDRTGDPLRTAFTKVNGNFTNIWNGNLGFLPDVDAARSTLRATTHVSTVSDLLALPGSGRTNIVFTLGRNSTTDRGGGLFAWVAGGSATTNTGTIFAATGGQWHRITEGGPVNVRWFGAAGDGVNDDSTAIQNAINHVQTSGTDAVVYVPSGIYRTTQQLNVTTGIRIVGDHIVGATSYEPMAWRGSMVRYEGTNGAALKLGGTGSFIFRPIVEHMRFGTIGQTPKPYGVVMEMVSEAKLEYVQFNGGFSAGMVLRNVTLSHFSRLEAAANDVAILIENDDSGGYTQDCSFQSLNLFLHSVAAVHIKGSARNLSFSNRCWFEFQPVGYLIERGSVSTVIDKITITDSTVSTGGLDYPQSRSIKVDAKTGADIGMAFRGLSAKNCLFYNNNSDYAVELLFAGNTNNNTVAYGFDFDGNNFYGVQTSALYSDSSNAEISFSGVTWARNAFSSGSFMPETSGSGKVHKSIVRFDHMDSYGGQIWRLPTVGPNTFLTGHFGWNTTHLKPYWHDGVNVKYAASVNDGNNLLATGAILTSGALVRSGLGSPEGATTAPIGSLFLRTDGGTGTSLYIKESGTGNTGWVAK